MQTKVQMWGNSLALRIPKSYAIEAGLEKDISVDLTFVDGKLIITPLSPTQYTLESLLAGITDDNLHGEVESGAAIGQEVW